MSLDIDTVRTISLLARLRIPEDQVAGLAEELSGILHWVEQLASVNTDGVEPMTSVAAITLHMRDDVVDDGGQAAAVLANVPEGIDDCFTVPKVVE